MDRRLAAYTYYPNAEAKKSSFLLRHWGSIEGNVSKIIEVRSNYELETPAHTYFPNAKAQNPDFLLRRWGSVEGMV